MRQAARGGAACSSLSLRRADCRMPAPQIPAPCCQRTVRPELGLACGCCHCAAAGGLCRQDPAQQDRLGDPRAEGPRRVAAQGGAGAGASAVWWGGAVARVRGMGSGPGLVTADSPPSSTTSDHLCSLSHPHTLLPPRPSTRPARSSSAPTPASTSTASSACSRSTSRKSWPQTPPSCGCALLPVHPPRACLRVCSGRRGLPAWGWCRAAAWRQCRGGRSGRHPCDA